MEGQCVKPNLRFSAHCVAYLVCFGVFFEELKNQSVRCEGRIRGHTELKLRQQSQVWMEICGSFTISDTCKVVQAAMAAW